MPELSDSIIVCQWLPGTMNQVILRWTGGQRQVSLEEFQPLAGPASVADLYLKGVALVPLGLLALLIDISTGPF